MEEDRDFVRDIQQEANIHESSLNDSQVGQAETLNQFQSSASFQGDNGKYINNILNTLVVPSIDGVKGFLMESFHSFNKITHHEDENNELIDLKQRELQLKIDSQYWPFHVGREDTYRILLKNRDKLIVIPSPPKILFKEQAFESIQAESFRALKEVLKKYYSPKANERASGIINSPSVVCENIFKSAIEGVHADLFYCFLAGIPTVIINTEITYLNVITDITVACSHFTPAIANSTDDGFVALGQPIHLSLPPLDWRSLKNGLCRHMNEEDCFREIINIIVHMQAVVSIFASDLYCMSSNFRHEPCLLDYTESSEFPKYLSEWIDPFTSKLSDLRSYLHDFLDKKEEQQQEQEQEIYEPHQGKSESFGQSSAEEPLLDISSDSEILWGVGVALGILAILFFGGASISGNSFDSSRKIADVELLKLEELERAADVWDDTTARKNLSILKRSKNPCVSEFAVMLERSLQSLGPRGFADIQPIKSQLNSQFNCDF